MRLTTFGIQVAAVMAGAAQEIAQKVRYRVRKSGAPDVGEYALSLKGVNMADKSPRKIVSKRSGKTLKEKRQEKKAKEQSRKGLGH